MSCQFLVIQGDRLPARIVEQHPDPAAISDALGGALAVPIFLGRGGALWVRETGATEGLERNVIASLILQVVTGETIPILGPAVMTQIVWAANPSGVSTALAEGWNNAELTYRWVPIVTDLNRAMTGANDGFWDDDLGEQWAANVRAAADRIRVTPTPEGWPYYSPETAVIARDPVWRGLAAHYEDGRAYVPLPIPN